MTETDNGVIITVDNKNGATTAFIKNGEKGEQGIQGKTGEKGDKGDKGDKGEDGTGVTILGSFDTEEELKLAHPTGEIGHSYLVAGSLYVWSTTENDWVNVGNIQGPKGDKGDTGETGPKGETGKDGAPGKSAYEYAKEAGYAKTESDFAQKLAAENYTKNEVDDLITSLIAKANHLQRTIVQSSLSIDPNAEGAENFIYMVPKSDSLSEDHYDEFMVIDGKVEKVGDWAVNLDGYATEEYVDKIVSTIDTDASLLVLVDISTMTANYSKTEIINASKSGKVVYADVSNQLFILKNALNASFAEMSYLTGGTKIDLTSFYIDDEKKVHLNVSDTFNLLPNYSTSDYGKYVTPSTNGLVYRELPNPVQSVNNKTGAVTLTASDVGARPSTWMPSASDVGALPDSTEIPSELSDLNEDANHRLVTDTEKAIWNAKSNFSGSYDDLTNKPAIPSITGLASTTYVDNAVKDKVDKDGNKVLSTNDYTTAEKNKLANIAAGAEVNVNADWNATSGDAQILNKPTLGSMAAKNSVAKGDLASEVQTSLGKADSALQPSDISDWAKAAAKPTYTASEVGALPDSTKIPSKLGDLDNDKQYITAAEVPDEIYVGDGTMPNTATIQFIMDASDEEALLKDELQEYINTEIEAAKTKLELDIPEKTSQLTNDSGFITAEDIPEVQVPDLSDYAKTKDIPTKTSQLTNDSGFITQHQSLAGYAKTSDIPTKVSQLTNDSGFITAKDIPEAQVPDLSGYALKSSAETWTFTLSDGSTVTKKVVLA